MALAISNVEEQLACDKAVKNINNFLDTHEQIIMLRGRDEDLMRGDYQNLLTYYHQMLVTVFLSTPCDQKQHSTYLHSLTTQTSEYFKSVSVCALGLNELLAAIPSAAYQEIINEVNKTISSRSNYFYALQRALPIGRYSFPADVAWFHRNNESLIKHYLAEHENDILSRPEDMAVKKICDFKVSKLAVVDNLQALIPKSASSAFFTSADDVRCEVGNYLRHYLQEPVRALAENNGLIDLVNYSKQLEEISKRFQVRLAALKIKNKEDSIELSEAAVKLIKVLSEVMITPFFDEVIEQFKVEHPVVNELSMLSL